MKTYKIQDKEAGNIIETGLTKQEAETKLKYFEHSDRMNDCFIPDFYEIKEEV